MPWNSNTTMIPNIIYYTDKKKFDSLCRTHSQLSVPRDYAQIYMSDVSSILDAQLLDMQGKFAFVIMLKER